MIKSYFGLLVKNFKIFKSIFILLSISGSSFALGTDYSDLSEDCMTFNLSASCAPPPKPPPPKKKKPTRNNYIKDEVLVLYPSSETSKIKSLVDKYNLKPIDKVILTSVQTGLLIAKTNGQDPLNLSKNINKKEENIEAATNNIFKPAAIRYNKAYSLYETGVSFVHKTTKGKGINICMVDTPIDIFHPSFSNSFIETEDLIDFEPNNLDAMTHGTSVAGVLVSQNNLIGVAPKAKLLAISAFSTTKTRPHILQGSSAIIAKAINSCIQHKVDVINLSFTGGRDALIEKLIQKAIRKGIIVVAAGGNGGHWGSTIYPALIPGVLTATAVDDQKMLFPMADKGSFIDYAAPGVNILTTAPGGSYTIATGTSLSSAHLSGIIALLLSQKRNQSIDAALTETAVDLGKPGRDQEFGEGLVSASRALAILKKQ